MSGGSLSNKTAAARRGSRPWGALSKPLPGGLCPSSRAQGLECDARGARKTYTQKPKRKCTPGS